MRRLGDGGLNNLSEMRLLAQYVLPVFDPFPPSNNTDSTKAGNSSEVVEAGSADHLDHENLVPPSWSRAVAR
ncbi:unnamed protein product [Protopolystoma xenopodis]|uniref:Uncharacterized protein n=1 Tax=Protopolystoma xenopodis TaxID=117903 RepID=A0A3S5APV1_9PLAT|nr:unnamed protein product [Protopolystoma xenopodis]